MRLRKFAPFLLLFTILFLASCSEEDSPTEPTDTGNGSGQGTTNNSGQPIPSMAQSGDGVLATISYEFQTVPGLPSASISMGFAQFGSGIDGGDVSVNGNSLGKTSQSGTTFYITPSPSNPTQSLSGVSFDGSNHSWQVSGNGDVPQVNGSVASPNSFSVSGPANNASITKSNGVDVSWTNTSANSRVLVVLVDIDNSGNYYAADVDDNGNHTIASGDISSFSGECMLQVVKYNYNTASAGGKTYYLISEIVKSTTITLN